MAMNSPGTSEHSKAIVDSFDRIHTYLRISLTERCNLRCTYCMPEDGVELSPKSALMTASEIQGIARVFTEMGVNKIRLTGGEPMVRKDFEEIAKSLAELPASLCITTNGILVDRHLDTLKNARIRQVNVSLDTLNEEKFRLITKRDDFAKVKANINLLLANEFTVKVNVVLMRNFNEDEICDFIDWSARENVHIRFIEFMPFNGNSWEMDKIVPYGEFMELVQKNYSYQIVPSQAHDTARAFEVQSKLEGQTVLQGHTGLAEQTDLNEHNVRAVKSQGTFGIISSMTNHFCGSCNRIRLTANGKLRNCLFSQNETDLLGPWRRGEDIRPIIHACFAAKHAKHGGVNELQKLGESREGNRSMILIGG